MAAKNYGFIEYLFYILLISFFSGFPPITLLNKHCLLSVPENDNTICFCLCFLSVDHFDKQSAAEGLCAGLLQPPAAVEQRHLLAQGVSDEYSEAIAWHRQLAEEGRADGQFYLGLMYATGRGLPRDYGKAAMWFRKAAEQGYPDARFELGRLYAVGNGVEQDIVQAYVLITLAAGQGHKKALELIDIIARQMDSVEMGEARELLKMLQRKK